MSNNNSINFVNALATVKDNASINEVGLRDTTVYAKLMLKSGKKFNTVKSTKDFLLSESGKYIKAELFYINKRGIAVYDNRMWLNVAIDAKIMRDDASKMYFVELIHPTLDLDNAVEAF